MSKEHYFEMCEMLGAEPVESEIPIEFEDFPYELQEIMTIYHKLKDEWNVVSGDYMGKSIQGILDIFKILKIPEDDYEFVFGMITLIDSKRMAVISERKAATAPASTPK